MNIAFRADASTEIGVGHVMRCLTLANELKKYGARIRFVGYGLSAFLLDMLVLRGIEFVSPDREITNDQFNELSHAKWLGASQVHDAHATSRALSDRLWDWIVVDHYALDKRWETILRPHAKRLLVIDDLADRAHDCDLLLDQNLFTNAGARYADKLPAHCVLMLGPHYALLQPEYAELHRHTSPREGPIKRIMVYFGNADALDLTGMAIRAFLLLGRSDIALDVVVHACNPQIESIRQKTIGHRNIVLHSDLPTLAPLMAQSDFAIGSGGTSSWERCCVGLPSLVITLADNQRVITEELDRLGAVRWLGHVGAVTVSILAHALEQFLSEDLPKTWSQTCQRVVDGRGCSRVRSVMMLSANTPLLARKVKLDDEALLLQWSNDQLVRQNAFSTGAIDAATHRAWFHKRLHDLEHCQLYVVETLDGFPVGQVRFERSGREWEIDYSLDALCRGAGLAKPLLRAAMITLRNIEPGAVVFGRVKSKNIASQRVFAGLGFEVHTVKSELASSEFVYRCIL